MDDQTQRHLASLQQQLRDADALSGELMRSNRALSEQAAAMRQRLAELEAERQDEETDAESAGS